MKVSIIVPVYNVEKYLSKCLDSLVKQTLKDIEIIIINDESPDDSQKIIDLYKKKYPKLIKPYKQKNGGQGSARNLGLTKAKGEYISFVDSDDWIDHKMLEKMYKIGKKENADIVICDMDDHYTNNIIHHNCTKFDTPYEVTPSACNKIFKKELIKDLTFIEKVWYEDFDFTTKALLKANKISIISEAFYHCHCRELSTMNNDNSLKNLDIITVIEDIKKFCKKEKLYDENLIQYLIFNHVLITSINRVAKQKSNDKKKVLKTMIEYCRENLTKYKQKEFYTKISLNRKAIAFLNYNYLYDFSKFILNLKAFLKKQITKKY